MHNAMILKDLMDPVRHKIIHPFISSFAKSVLHLCKKHVFLQVIGDMAVWIKKRKSQPKTFLQLKKFNTIIVYTVGEIF